MSRTLRLVHLCDHTVQEITISKEVKSITKGNDEELDLITSNQIDSVDFISFDGYLLFQDSHFVTTSNKIEWIGDTDIIPISGAQYQIHYNEKSITNRGYQTEACPKCNGKGWYVDLISSDNEALFSATGLDKLVQDFIKVFLTDSRFYNYGTNLNSIIGKSASQDSALSMIKMSVREAEEVVKKSQYEMSLGGIELSDDEILRVVDINEISIHEGGEGFYLQITLLNKKNLSASVGLNL